MGETNHQTITPVSNNYNIFNIFSVLKLERKETIHSAMIAAIASHDEKCQEYFFRMLKEVVENKPQNYVEDKSVFLNGIEKLENSIDLKNREHSWIDTEVHLTEMVNGKMRDRGRADIWLGTNNYHGESEKIKVAQYRLIIENKIDADFQYRQLRKYYRYLTNEPMRYFAGLFVLCIRFDDDFKKKAENAAKKFNTESKPTIKDKQTDFAIITYKDIINWLDEVILRTAEKDFKTAVKQYQTILQGFYSKEK